MTPLKNDVPSPIERWSVTKWNLEEKKLKKKFPKKNFWPPNIFLQSPIAPEDWIISGLNLVLFCYRPSFYRGRNIIFEGRQNGYFFNFGEIFSEGCAPMGIKTIFPKITTQEVLGNRRSSKNKIPLPYLETRFQMSMC